MNIFHNHNLPEEEWLRTKSRFKNANLNSSVDIDIDKFKNVPTNLSNLKSKIDKLDVDKLVTVPVELSEPSDVVKKCF